MTSPFSHRRSTNLAAAILLLAIGGLLLDSAVTQTIAADNAASATTSVRSASPTDAGMMTPVAILAEAAAVARGIQDAGAKASKLAQTAEAQVRIGLKERGRKTFAEAFVAARQDYEAGLKNNGIPDNALCKIVEAQIDAGFLADAIATTQLIRGPAQKNRALEKIVSAEIAAKRFDEAIVHARKMENILDTSTCGITACNHSVTLPLPRPQRDKKRQPEGCSPRRRLRRTRSTRIPRSKARLATGTVLFLRAPTPKRECWMKPLPGLIEFNGPAPKC